MADYALTTRQQAAVAELQKAFAACRRAGVYFWDDYCVIRAVNGRVVQSVCVDPRGLDGELDRDQATSVFSVATANADDTLYVQLCSRASDQQADSASGRAQRTNNNEGD